MLEVRTLPNSGRITLNQIKAEFKQGNNLRSYLGVVAGVPSFWQSQDYRFLR